MSRRQWVLLLSTTLASSLVPFLSSSVSVAIATIAEDLRISLSFANWANNSFLIPLAATVLIAGRIGDWIGRSFVYIAGLLLFTASSAAALIPSRDPYAFFAVRAIQGISGALVTSVAVALISEAFPPERRGRVIGINTMAVYLGLSLGPLLGGALTSLLGWRSIFLFTFAVSAASLAAALPSVERKRGSMNPPGALESIIFTISTVAIAYGTSLMNEPSLGVALILSGSIAFLLLMLLERRREALLHHSLFNPRLLMSYAAAMLNYSATFALTVLLSVYLEKIRGLSPLEAGAVLTVQPVIQAALSPLAGYLAEKIDPSLIATSGMGIISVGIASLLPVVSSRGFASVYLSLVLIGVGFALFASPNTTAIVSYTPREAFASSLAFLATMRYFGQAISTSIITSVEGIFSPLNRSLLVGLEIYIALSVLGTALSYSARRS